MKFATIFALFLLAPLAHTQQSDESAVRAVVQREITAWDKFDAPAIAACYTADTTWQNPFGVRIHSRAELEKFLTKLFQRPDYRAATDTSPAQITDVHMLSPTTAVVWSEEKSEGQLDEKSGKPFSRASHYLEVLVKQDGHWLIADSMIMDEYPR